MKFKPGNFRQKIVNSRIHKKTCGNYCANMSLRKRENGRKWHNIINRARPHRKHCQSAEHRLLTHVKICIKLHHTQKKKNLVNCLCVAQSFPMWQHSEHITDLGTHVNYINLPTSSWYFQVYLFRTLQFTGKVTATNISIEWDTGNMIRL